MLFDLFGDHSHLLPALFFLFHGLRGRGHSLTILPPEDIHTLNHDLLLMDRGQGEVLFEDGRENVGLLEERGSEYSLYLPTLERRYTFSLGPLLDFYKTLEFKEESYPLTILLLWLTGDDRSLKESLQGMEMISRSLPRFRLQLITRREYPKYNSPLSPHLLQLFHLSPENLLEEYKKASLCLGLVPHPYFLQDVLVCKTPVISIKEEFYPQIPHVSPKARDIAVMSLKILKIGQLANRLVRDGVSLVKELDASKHLSHLEEILLELQKESLLTNGPGGDGGEGHSISSSEDLEEGLFQTSIALRKALLQVLDFFQGKKRGP